MPPKKASTQATAASARPRRETTTATPATTKAPTTKAAATKKRKAPVSAAEPAKKRGRPSGKSAATLEEDDKDDAPAEPAKARGRPKKDARAVAEKEEAVPRKRGRPPKGGPTTKIAADDDAAAEQLEDELVDTATADAKAVAEPADRKRDPRDVDGANGTAEQRSGKQYWLMKAEQEDRMETTKNGSEVNTRFTIDDLRNRTDPEPWDGVRNAVAAKNMRAMRTGDLAFFYASQGKQGRKPSITGIMEIVSEAEPDATVADEGSIGYVEKESDRGRWCIVRVEFRKKLSTPVSLKQLQNHKDSDGALRDMQLFKQSRLSVSKVTQGEWDFIVHKLIEGYEEDANTA